MKILDLYESILKAGNLIVTKDGCVSKKIDDEVEPFIIKGKRVVLPTKEHLSNPDWKERVAFHPLSENVLRKESDVLEEFRMAIISKLNFSLGMLTYNLLTIAGSEADHSKLNPDQSEILSVLKKVNQKTVDVFTKIMSNMNIGDSKTSFIHIYLKRSATIDGKRYQRGGVVTFPIYEELIGDSNTVFGVKVDAKDRKILTALFEYIFPTINKSASYNRGSNSEVAPYLDALMKSVIAVGGPINDQLNQFSNFIEKYEQLLINDEWVETFDNLNVMVNEIRSIPMQAGNEGKPVTQPTQPVDTQQKVETPLPTVLMGGQQKQSIWGTQPQPLQKSADGVEFDTLLRSNPALAQSLGYINNSNFGGQMMQADPTPSWARPNSNVGGGIFNGIFNQGGFQQQRSNFGGWGGGSGTAL